MAWKVGDRLSHRHNPELGPGRVEAVEGRTLTVSFPQHGTLLRLAAGSAALEPLDWPAGSAALLLDTGELVTVLGLREQGRILLSDGRQVAETELWPVPAGDSPIERLARGDIDSLESFALRVETLHLASIREADGLGSFLGGRIRLFPHQLHAATSATRTDPVRWLLADEVGLGKTVEACLILNHLLRTGRADRVLVVAPETLTVQWLGELWRKYHQVFVLLDAERLADVERDHGPGFNPFDAHRRVVLGSRFLCDHPRLTEQAVEAAIDLLIVDEAHHLRRRAGHPGNAAYRAVRPIADLGRHVVLLTATPLEEDAEGFFRLLQILRPEAFPENELHERVERPELLPPCTGATRREDVGGFPPRVAVPVQPPGDWEPFLALERLTRSLPAEDPVARRLKLRRIRLALSSGPALEAVLGPAEADTRALARRAFAADPRVAWLVDRAAAWRKAGDKTLVFVSERETLEALKGELDRRAHLRVAVFHEDLSARQRDIEVAQFRLGRGPSLLLSTECGGEGRNFEFCTRLVLFDLPWNPLVVEQRIGRLDRIGRTLPVEIVDLRPPSGLGATVARLYDELGLGRGPLVALERELLPVEATIESLALDERHDPAEFAEIVASTRSAQDRVRRAALRELHRDPYRPEMAGAILDRVPEDLEEATREVVLGWAEQLGLHVEAHRDGRRHSIELGSEARIQSLPGVAPGSSFLGTFDREEAVQDESVDFFSSGHPLVEGILSHLEESPAGRVGLLHVEAPGEGGFGLLALFRSGPHQEAVAVDSTGRERPDWARWLMRRPLRSKRVDAASWVERPEWPALIRRLGGSFHGRGRPEALAAFRVSGLAQASNAVARLK